MRTASTTKHLLITNMSKRDEYPERRQTAVAGSFYPRDPKAMSRELDQLFNTARKRIDRAGAKPEHCAAAIVPHAGWIYSGELAAETLLRVAVPDRAIVFAPKHRPGGIEWAVAPYLTWEIPGGELRSDPGFAAKMVAAVDQFQFDPIPHREEHAIEVQLPLLHRIHPGMRVVGVTLATASWPMIRDAAEQLAAFLEREDDWPLLIVSSDMNHYGSEEATKVVDRMALEPILALDPEALLTTVRENGISMCGVTAAALVMETLRIAGRLHEAILVGRTTSAAKSGDSSRVVGYAGVLFR